MLRRILALLCLTIAAFGAGTFPRPLADVPILTPEGKTIQLSQYRGKVLVVLVILTTCEHCAHSAELLNNLQKEFGKDFQPVVVAVNPEAPKETAGFRQTHHLTYPMGFLVNEDNIMKLADFKREDHPLSPMYLFVDKKGTVQFQYFGGNDVFFKNEDVNVHLLVGNLLKK